MDFRATTARCRAGKGRPTRLAEAVISPYTRCQDRVESFNAREGMSCCAGEKVYLCLRYACAAQLFSFPLGPASKNRVTFLRPSMPRGRRWPPPACARWRVWAEKKPFCTSEDSTAHGCIRCGRLRKEAHGRRPEVMRLSRAPAMSQGRLQ